MKACYHLLALLLFQTCVTLCRNTKDTVYQKAQISIFSKWPGAFQNFKSQAWIRGMGNEIVIWIILLWNFSASKNCNALVSKCCPTLKPMHHDSVSNYYGWIKTNHTQMSGIWCSGKEDTSVAHLHNNSCVYIVQ